MEKDEKKTVGVCAETERKSNIRPDDTRGADALLADDKTLSPETDAALQTQTSDDAREAATQKPTDDDARDDDDKKKKKKHIIPVTENDEYPDKEDAHMMGSNTFLDISFDENFEYIIKNPFKRFFANLLWVIGMSVLPFITFVAFGFKIKGKKYVKKVRQGKSGAITVSNHCLMMDCCMACQANWPKMTYLPTLYTTFQLPYVRHIVHWLNAFPIPNTRSGMKKFISEVDGLLQKGRFVHFFPEGSLWPWYDAVRSFKPGGFHFAVKNNVPVIPMAIVYRPRRLTKLFSKRPLVSLEILPPLYPDGNLKPKACAADLSDRAHDAIRECMEKNNLKYYGKKSTKAKNI